MHDEIARSVGLEVEGDLAGHAGQVGEKVTGRAVSLENVTEGLKNRKKNIVESFSSLTDQTNLKRLKNRSKNIVELLGLRDPTNLKRHF